MTKCFMAGEILLPVKKINYSKWSVVACDQFTSKVSYWQQLESQIGSSPSALNLILPECYLDTKDEQQKKEAIYSNMRSYINANIFDSFNGYILTNRTTSYGNCRSGLVMQIDLQDYDFDPSKKALIRATEGTVIERIPPRVVIRENCALELPHIMLLIDDPDDTVMAAARASKKVNVYDFDLNMRGGHLVGDFIEDTSKVDGALNKLYETSENKYGEKLLMAVGDGNHSLAAAKQTYLNALRAGEDVSKLRYALVEVVNIYDSGLKFEPIHRVIFNVNALNFTSMLFEASRGYLNGKESVNTNMYTDGIKEDLALPRGTIEGVSFVETFLDDYTNRYGGKVDYIHGVDELIELGKNKDTVAIELKAMDKGELFNFIVKNGVLPRKTFSMGEAEEKRYYLEARKIR